jgi:hypothetical protein
MSQQFQSQQFQSQQFQSQFLRKITIVASSLLALASTQLPAAAQLSLKPSLIKIALPAATAYRQTCANVAWQARHGMTSAQYQQTFNQLVAEGYRLVQVSGYGSGGQDRYAAIWDKCATNAWIARHGMTSAQYQQEFNQHVAQGYQLVWVNGYAVNGQDRYAAIWEKRSNQNPWVARHGMTSAQYQQEFNQLTQAGYRLTQVSAYNVGKDDRYAAIWEKRSGPAWQARHGLFSEQYQQQFNQITGQGYRPVQVSGYAGERVVGDEQTTCSGDICQTKFTHKLVMQDRYAAIWDQQSSHGWVARHGMTSTKYQQEFDHWVGEGYRLVNVSGYTVNGQDLYAAIWEK